MKPKWISCDIDYDMHTRLKTLQFKKGMHLNHLIREALDEYLYRHKM